MFKAARRLLQGNMLRGELNMSTIEMRSMVNELRELRRMADELNAEIETIQDKIKAEMTARNVETLAGADYKITWKQIVSTRFDSKAFKSAMPDLYGRYCKESISRRFVLA